MESLFLTAVLGRNCSPHMFDNNMKPELSRLHRHQQSNGGFQADCDLITVHVARTLICTSNYQFIYAAVSLATGVTARP